MSAFSHGRRTQTVNIHLSKTKTINIYEFRDNTAATRQLVLGFLLQAWDQKPLATTEALQVVVVARKKPVVKRYGIWGSTTNTEWRKRMQRG